MTAIKTKALRKSDGSRAEGEPPRHKPRKVLFCSRLDLLDVLGGDTIQVLETKAALEKHGIEIDIGLEAEPDVRAYDMVHIFNTQFADLGLQQIQHVKKQGVPVTLSTIYWDLKSVQSSPDFQRYDVGGFIGRFGSHQPELTGALIRTLHERRSHMRSKIRRILVLADVLLPNSLAELEILVHEFDYPMARAKAFVVPNAVKPTPRKPPLSDKSRAILDALPPVFAIEAARIESVKGQLQLLRATRRHGLDIPLVFVGGHRPSAYFDAFQAERADRPNVHHVGIIPHDELPHFYARAKVHALPSLRESPGLATLEAAVAGCNCVVGIHAPVQEYFGNDAWVCDPADLDSIGQAMRAAWQAPRNANPGFAARVKTQFTWDRAAEETLRGYDFVLARQHAGA